MPTRGKRTRDWDPNRSDSDDETWGASPSKVSRSKPNRAKGSKPPRKKPRRGGYDGTDEDDDEDDIDSDDDELSNPSGGSDDENDEEEEDIEFGATGRPKRKAAKKNQPIIDEDSEEIDDDEGDAAPEARGSTSAEKVTQPTKVVTLRYPPGRSPLPHGRSKQRQRRSSSGAQGSRPTSSGAEMEGRRRSLRKATEAPDAPTDELLEAEQASKRPTRGGKGPKKEPVPTQGDDEPGSVGKTQDQPSTDELQRDHFRREIAESRENLAEDELINEEVLMTDTNEAAIDASGQDVDSDQRSEIPESVVGRNDADHDEDEGPINRSRRVTRTRGRQHSASSGPEGSTGNAKATSTARRQTRSSQKTGNQESSDFEPGAEEGEEDDVSDSEASSPRKHSHEEEDDSPVRRESKRRRTNNRSNRVSDETDETDEQEELRNEIDELTSRPRRRKALPILMDNRARRKRDNKVNYNIMASNEEIMRAIEANEEDAAVNDTPSKRNRTAGGYGRSLFSTYGPFGGAGGAPPVLGGPTGLGALGGADSDSSEDEQMQRPKRVGTGIGGAVGMTPSTAHPTGNPLFPPGQVIGTETAQGVGGTPANLGKIKDRQALADADPLGVDQNVNFDNVGGLQGHVNQLKEMVMLPLLYPEVFQRFRVTPPRGVLFHGPPGTGKTLLARALASSVSSRGKKVTFYMRKGADALSKWVGEAERQLRLLFDEARKTQPSIIFFDEIDGLAPVRSSKQEQIHASIVSTLLALMDGMDGRGQVIVIGATNRPDSVDPALRRPGRFDREFYFPLPNEEARRAILDIHTKGWNPPLDSRFKNEIAKSTKGYGGADLRALCTEAALNAVQRRYPQIYKSDEKLQIRPETIHVNAKDFMISIKKMVPSSERSASSNAAPLPRNIEPLLRESFDDLKSMAAETLPQVKVLTALEEAEYEDMESPNGMATERMQQEFERSRVFRPRLLLRGSPGMGQQYLAAALLNHFESLHVQAFDLATLLSDSTRSSEAAIVQLFTEVRRHKPSVIFIPNVNTWYRTVGHTVISTFCGLLQAVSPSDPIMVLGVLESDMDVDPDMVRSLFGFSRRCQFTVQRPLSPARAEYFAPIREYIETSPADFPSPASRKKRTLEILPPAPPEQPKEAPELTKAELKSQKKRDRLLLNQLKIRIQPIMNEMKRPPHRKVRLAVIEEKDIRYLFEDDDPEILTSDLPREQQNPALRPYEKAYDSKGELGLKETATGKFFYNLDVATIEKRLSNGYYKRPKDFLADVKKLSKDAETLGDAERFLKAKELETNVQVDMGMIEVQEPLLVAELENVYQREVKREKDMIEKAKRQAAEEGRTLESVASNVPPQNTIGSATEVSSGPIKLAPALTNGLVNHRVTPSNPSSFSNDISDLSNLEGHATSITTSIPSHEDADVQMTNSDERPSPDKVSAMSSSFGPSAQTVPPESYTGPPKTLEQRKSIPNSLSQSGAITPMVEGSQPADYANDASTTSSEKRNTGSSGDRETGGSSQILTQNQSLKEGPDLSIFNDETEANSQLPDTQEQPQSSAEPSEEPHQSVQSSPVHRLSQSDGSFSQTPPVPKFSQERSRASIDNILNDEPPPRSRSPPTKGLPPVTITRERNEYLFNEFVNKSSGCSVEQLEQLYSAMMSVVWSNRHRYDRDDVMRLVNERFEEEIQDIRAMQGVEQSSMTSEFS